MATKKPTNKEAAERPTAEEVAEIRELREAVEKARLDVARLEGRLDMIQVFLKFDPKTSPLTESQAEFAKRLGFNLPEKKPE